MSDLKTQLGDYFDNVVERLDVEDIFEQQVDGSRVQPVQPRTPRRVVPGWVYGVAAAVAILLMGVVGLLVGNGSNVADNQTSTSSQVLDPGSPLAVAESFMEAWVAGDGDAVAAMVTSDVLVDGREPEMLPALHDWYRAVGQKFQNEGCELRTITFKTFQGVSCEYTFENELTRALGREPVTGDFFFYIGPGRIERASVLGDQPDYHVIGEMFRDWVLINHPDDFERMFGGLGPLLDPTSIALWERYTDELTASPGAAARFFREQETRVEASWEYLDQAQAICKAATDQFRAAEAELGLDQGYFGLVDIAAGYEALVRISEEALAEMRALPQPPEAARGPFRVFYALADLSLDIQRQTAAAASAGDNARVEMLSAEGLELAHQMDGLPYDLQRCPVYQPGG